MRTKAKSDRPLGVAIIVVVALLAFILTTIIYCVHYMYAFNIFKRDVQYSMAQTKKGIGIEFSYDDEVRSYNEEDWKKFSNFLRLLNAGKKQKEFPGDETGDVLTIAFPDDTKLEFCAVEITAKTRERDDGICIRYTRADDSTYIFTTDQYGFETVKYWFQ